MVERLVHIIKHGLTILSFTNIQGWDIQLPKILFGYYCGVQANTRYSPYMVLRGSHPRLVVDNSLNGLCKVIDEQMGLEAMVEQMIWKMQLVSIIHKTLLKNVEQAQKKQCKV
jgi:hypothetical protein